MKKTMLTAAFAALAILALTPAAMAGAGHDHDKKDGHAAMDEQTWTGWITDAQCGANNANAKGKQCALDCYENGSKLVLYVNADEQIYEVDQQKKASKHIGHEVRVTGSMKDGMIKIKRIEKVTAG